jgi:putative SOS response-associated peptidase YedK
MCNLYSLDKGPAAIRALARVWDDRTGNLAPLPAIFPDRPAPVVRSAEGGRVMQMMRWGMPSPAFALKGRRTDPGVTNVRNCASPHWRPWLGPAHRCVVPFTSFSEYRLPGAGAGAGAAGQKAVPVWFALGEDRPLAVFAGIWTRWTSVRKLKEGEVTADLFAFLTTAANAEVAAVHPKAMPVILTRAEEIDLWLEAPLDEALRLQRPLADGMLRIVAEGALADPPPE